MYGVLEHAASEVHGGFRQGYRWLDHVAIEAFNGERYESNELRFLISSARGGEPLSILPGWQEGAVLLAYESINMIVERGLAA